MDREQILAYKREYYKRNREVCLARNNANNKKNRPARRLREAAYRAEHPEVHRAAKSLRRGLKRNAAGRHTGAELKAKFEQQGGKCASAACGVELKKTGRDKYHWDHIVPLVRGGSNWISNMQALCPACNMSKNDRDPAQWATETGTPLELKEEDSTVYSGKRERKYTQTLGIRLDRDAVAEIRAKCEAEGRTTGEWLREAIDEKLGAGATLDMVFAELVMFRKLFQEMQLPKWRNGKFEAQELVEEVAKKDARRVAGAAERVLEYRQQA